jgi:hypothetical protein
MVEEYTKKLKYGVLHGFCNLDKILFERENDMLDVYKSSKLNFQNISLTLLNGFRRI